MPTARFDGLQMAEYPFPNASHEISRLALQNKIYEPATEAFLKSAGIGGAMRVLDVGCGSGVVTRLVGARLNGKGRVLGIDLSDRALRDARDLEKRNSPIRYQRWDLRRGLPNGPFDAVIGRFILMYFRRPGEALRHFASAAKKDGIIAFQEPDHTDYMVSTPPSSLFDLWRGRITRTANACKVFESLGLKLAHFFQRAGLEVQGRHVSYREDSSHCLELFKLFAATAKGMEPRILKTIPAQREIQEQTLAATLQAEARRHKALVGSSRLIGVWGRKRGIPQTF